MTETIPCPTCGAAARLLVCGQCEVCADGEVAAAIERLTPEEERDG